MNKKNNSRKGATLAELIIVLAVLVIAATMVVSFSSMMHGAQGISNERFEAMQDVTAAESIIEGFIESHASAENYVSIDDNDHVVFHSVSDPTKTTSFNFYNNVDLLLINYLNGSNVSMEFEHIESITFELEATIINDSMVIGGKATTVYGGDIIYYCTINYSVDKTNYTYTFCVNPYAGE